MAEAKGADAERKSDIYLVKFLIFKSANQEIYEDFDFKSAKRFLYSQQPS